MNEFIKMREALQPTAGMIVSNGEIDFLIHDVTEAWIYGVSYPTVNRGQVKTGAYSLRKVEHDDYRQTIKQATEVVQAVEV